MSKKQIAEPIRGVTICLFGDAGPTKKHPLRRGCCRLHFDQYLRQRARLVISEGEREAQLWEDHLVAKGLLLPESPDVAKDEDPFLKDAKEFVAKLHQPATGEKELNEADNI